MAGAGVGFGAGFTMAQQMMNAMRPDQPGGPARKIRSASGGSHRQSATFRGAVRTRRQRPLAKTKFCFECGKSIPKRAKFCPECGTQQ